MRLKHIFLAVSFASMASCGAGFSDMEEELGNGYKYLGSGEGNKTIIWSADEKSSDSTIINPTVIAYASDKHFIIASQKMNRDQYVYMLANEIDTRVRAFKYADSLNLDEENYQWCMKITKEYEADSSFYRQLGKYATLGNTIEDQNFFRHIADSVLAHDPQYTHMFDRGIRYWIIHKQTHAAYGPLDSNQYYMLRDSLDIPLKLKL